MGEKMSVAPTRRARLVSLALSWSLLVGCGDVVLIEDLEQPPAGDLGPDARQRDQGSGADLARLDMGQGTDLARDQGADQGADQSLDQGLDQALWSDMADLEPELPPTADEQPSLYPAQHTLWPMTSYGVERLRAIAARSPQRAWDVFIKVGDSNTVNANFLHCFATDRVSWGEHAALEGTRQRFRAGQAQGASPYDRQSLAAVVGWSAGSALAGQPSPIEREVSALNPRFAFVQFGTNDIQSRAIFRYADQMVEIVEGLMAQGVIPILTSIAPRADDAAADAWVPRYNAVMRALAQAHQLPFIDLHRELLRMDGLGLGSDRLHLNAYTQGARACELTSTGLGWGQNMRNLLSMQALDRLLAALLQGRPAAVAGPSPQPLPGLGTHEQPYVIPGLPFVDRRDTSTHGERRLNRYTGCAATQDESGPEIVYELTLARRTTLRLMVFDPGQVDIDLHVLDGTLSEQGCLRRAHQDLLVTLEAGRYDVVLDTFVGADGRERSGPYLLTILEE